MLGKQSSWRRSYFIRTFADVVNAADNGTRTTEWRLSIRCLHRQTVGMRYILSRHIQPLRQNLLPSPAKPCQLLLAPTLSYSNSSNHQRL